MQKILLYYNFSYPLGGGDYLPLSFTAELLKNNKVTLAVDSISGFERASRFFDFSFDKSDLDIVQLMPNNYNVNNHNKFLSFYRNKKLKKLAATANLCISTANIIDFGCPAHYFVNFLGGIASSFDDITKHNKTLKPSFSTQIGYYLQEYFLRPFMSMRSKRAIVRNPQEQIYPNSLYVQSIMEKVYGSFNSHLFYPPTLYEPQRITVERNPMRILCLGRIHPNKRIMDIIEIIEHARILSGKDLQLVIAGPQDNSSNYSLKIKQTAENKTWITLSDGIKGQDKDNMLQSSSFAVHARRNEEFGISITEYLKAGIIPIVPDEGGSCEVMNNPALTFHTNEEAAQILVRLLDDAAFREAQLRLCADRARFFSRQAYEERQSKLLMKIVRGE